jgi:hypothetical protein
LHETEEKIDKHDPHSHQVTSFAYLLLGFVGVFTEILEKIRMNF